MTEEPDKGVSASLRYQLERIIGDMRDRAYPPLYFMRALNWPDAAAAEPLERCKALLRNPEGQTTAFEYKRQYDDGLTLEDVVISLGPSVGFDSEDIAIARRTLGA